MISLLAQGGGRTGLPWQQILSILFGLLVFVGPLIQSILKAAKERRQQQQVELDRRRQQDEYLRTGRMPPSNSPDAPSRQAIQQTAPFPSSDDEAKRRLAEIARRRREELEKLARATGPAGTAPASAQVGSPTASSPPTRTPGPVVIQSPSRPASAPRPAAPVVAVPRPASTREQLVRQQQQRQQQENERRKREAEQRRRAEQQKQFAPTPGASADFHSVSQSISDPPGTVHRLVKDAPAAPGTPRPPLLRSLFPAAGNSASPAHSDELKRAIMLTEILGPPVSQRTR